MAIIKGRILMYSDDRTEDVYIVETTTERLLKVREELLYDRLVLKEMEDGFTRRVAEDMVDNHIFIFSRKLDIAFSNCKASTSLVIIDEATEDDVY